MFPFLLICKECFGLGPVKYAKQVKPFQYHLQLNIKRIPGKGVTVQSCLVNRGASFQACKRGVK